MKYYQKTLEEKLRIDAEIAEMKKYPIDYSDIPPMTDAQRAAAHWGNEDFLRKLPPDIVQEMVRRRLAELKRSGYEIPETSSAGAPSREPSLSAEKV
ncbi:hypothetical protein AGMMS50255_7700 [Spirochaetia bacterium]|nr:hypothetical protein AGMMS50255_7700 [Spirochaetia bacterium]